ncbi:MAG: isoprenylcysteine carboxylmethyltransferase family protein [Phycisphaerae bacterium]|nr:isoprenylcysteine carboxylmethyltransferase family protein [Phycisphaerae bacterium]MDD5381575.1 isoprenylcysteine carboxylmethyltransferase family protein [Phycisphaerae bacterium]
MLLKEKLESTGNFLFKWRSFLPLLTIGLFLIVMRQSSHHRNEHYPDMLWDGICFGVSLFGLAIRVFTVGFVPKGTSGRTTGNPKASTLNTTGMYSVIRHPLYLGNFFVWLGVSMFPHSLVLVISLILLFSLYYWLITLAEEKILREKFGNTFAEWAHRTPLLFPRFRNWQKAALPFSLKTVLKREYTTLFAIITIFTCLEIGKDFFYSDKLVFDPVWVSLFLTGLCLYIIVRTLKKKGVLNVEGR